MKESFQTRQKKRKRTTRIVLLVFTILFLIAVLVFYMLFRRVMSPIVKTPDKKEFSLYIPTNADFQLVKDSLYAHNLITNPSSFEWLCRKKDYPNHIHAGRYILRDGMSNRQLTNMLRGGLQTPVKVTFNNQRDIK